MSQSFTKKVKDLHPNSVIYISRVFVKYKDATITDIAEILNITSNALSAVLLRGVAENIVSDEMAEKIYARYMNIRKKNIPICVKYWEKAFDQRSEAKRIKRISESN